MNTALNRLVASLLIITPIAVDAETVAGEPDYERLSSANRKEREIIALLEQIAVDDVVIHELAASEALEYLRIKVVGEGSGGMINLAIQGSEEGRQKATINAKRINFASAVDKICSQTGWQWAIEFSDISRSPTLVLSTTNNEDDITQ